MYLVKWNIPSFGDDIKAEIIKLSTNIDGLKF